ncbi:hypothetical protein ABWK42_21135 [Bacillus sp. JJ927]
MEKIKNIEIPNVFPEPLAAGVGNVGERKTLGELFSVAKSETKGRAHNANRLSGEKVPEEGIRKAGVGKTGEGIPLEEVKPDVLKQIHPDDNGAYGYLPNEGTAYHKPEYDFTDVDWVKGM